MLQTFFRIVHTDPPTERDFYSHQRRGLPLRDPKDEDIWRGVSLYATFVQARNTAKSFPTLGRFIASVQIDDDDPAIRVERTSLRRGHFTAWALPTRLLSLVVKVESVEGNPDPLE